MSDGGNGRRRLAGLAAMLTGPRWQDTGGLGGWHINWRRARGKANADHLRGCTQEAGSREQGAAALTESATPNC